MATKMVAIWFPHLMTDWILRRQPALKQTAFVLVIPERGRKVVKAVNQLAQEKGAYVNMVAADCRTIVPDLQILDYDPEQPRKLLSALAEWCIRYSPFVAVDLPDGLILDATGCTHLWGGDEPYLQAIENQLSAFGYCVKTAIADTIGLAWGLCRFGSNKLFAESQTGIQLLSLLPPAALRLDTAALERLEKLGLKTIGSFIKMPRSALRRRFGQGLLTRLDQALGYEMEIITPVKPIAPYRESLPCMDLIRTAPGIEVALKTLLTQLCQRLNRENKGLRKCILNGYRIDGNIQTIAISTSRASRNLTHLFKLFENRIAEIEPDLGIELFILEASVVEDLEGKQDVLWTVNKANESAIAELLDRLTGKAGPGTIYRYLPDEHYWPERSIKLSTSLAEKPLTTWPKYLLRPLHLLQKPEPIEVTVPIPDYPPLLFKYKGILHSVKKADGPERIEQEWWIEAGLYRDYYCVEDEQGARYWLFRSGDYNSGNAKWFLHGFFA
jgi:protein ImuB